jgi:putative membrane protein
VVPSENGRAGILVRGMMMGAADIVPGVSGGTIAFITGIYDRLLASIAAADLACLRLLLRGRLLEAWRRIDGAFLVTLFAGIFTSILTLARVIGWLLENQPILVWSFFFGLIAGSAVYLLSRVSTWNPARLLLLAVGALAAVAIALSPSFSLGLSPLSFFCAGFVAICAMILPGISGSFILILLGMYDLMLDAIRGMELVPLGAFMAGAVCGLLAFSRLLNWLLHRYHAATMALLTGFLLGSLLVVWPWKEVVAWIAGSDGEPKPARQLPVWPWQYAAETGLPSLLPAAVLLMLVGAVAVWGLERRWGAKLD